MTELTDRFNGIGTKVWNYAKIAGSTLPGFLTFLPGCIQDDANIEQKVKESMNADTTEVTYKGPRTQRVESDNHWGDNDDQYWSFVPGHIQMDTEGKLHNDPPEKVYSDFEKQQIEAGWEHHTNVFTMIDHRISGKSVAGQFRIWPKTQNEILNTYLNRLDTSKYHVKVEREAYMSNGVIAKEMMSVWTKPK